MIVPWYKHKLVFANWAVYALGGYSKSKTMTSKVERYDFELGEWTGCAKMYKERQSFFAVSSISSRCIYVMGGCYLDSDNWLIEKYDTERDVWVILDVKLDFDLNEFHHVFTIMEGGIDIFKEKPKQ